MNMRVLCLIATLALAGCPVDKPAPVDAADVQAETAPDVVLDTEPEAGDAEPEVADVEPEAAEDVEPETTDATSETVEDAEPDAPAETAPDAPEPDVELETATD